VNLTDFALSAVRGVHIAASLSVFGVLLLWSAVLAPASRPADGTVPPRLHAQFRHLFHAGILAAVVSAAIWLLIEAGQLADAASLSEAFSAVGPVLGETRFGHVLELRVALLLLIVILLGRGAMPGRRTAAAAAAGLALLPHAWLAHAGATGGREGAILLVAEALHLLAAGAWAGSLLPLLLAIGALAPAHALWTVQRYSRLGVLCVVTLAATALAQGWILIGGLPGLLGTAYGRVALLKLVLFAAMAALAAGNRFSHMPALAGPDEAAARRRLRRSMAFEAAIGLLVVLAAGFLANLTPAAHEQPVWPFAWQPSLEALGDPDLGRIAATGLLGLGGAVLLIVLGLVWRHLLPFLLAGAAVLLIWALPDLRLFFVDAYPTSFYQSPTGFTAQSIARGAALYPVHCAACHGAEGRGDGPAAKSLPIPPADLTAPHLWAHSDGELFWWLAKGIEAPQGGLAMPGFADRLCEDDRWALIDYVRARNAGLAAAATAQWPQPVLAPDVQLRCADGYAGSLGGRRGRLLRIILLPTGGPRPAPAPVSNVWITIDPRFASDPGGCVAEDPAAMTAYTVMAGQGPDDRAEAQLLVDEQGWLRARWHAGEAVGWTEPRELSAMIEQIQAHPIAASAGGHAHQH
jgi:putative copper export protein/mono/diheme cytochrome c family protein